MTTPERPSWFSLQPGLELVWQAPSIYDAPADRRVSADQVNTLSSTPSTGAEMHPQADIRPRVEFVRSQLQKAPARRASLHQEVLQ